MHKEYKRIVEGASIGILLIHGIVSSPNHFRGLSDLIPEGISVHALLLEGHGKEVTDFSKASMEEWVTQVARAVEDMGKDHEEIYILAHSMGTLLAIEQAVRNPKITRMFLLASPLQVFVKPIMVPTSLKISYDKVDPDDPAMVATKGSYSIAPDKNLFRYIGWAPRFLELLTKCRKTRKLIKEIKCPTWVFQSGKDELVSMRSCKYLRDNPNISLNVLPDSGHCYYAPDDLKALQEAFTQFFI